MNVFTNGCFDLLHAGHVRFLQQAARLGDTLTVGLNSDASVRRLKGPGRPVVGQEDRAATLRVLRCVSAVAMFDEDTPGRLLAELRPDVVAKGWDAPADLPELEDVPRWGGRVIYLPRYGELSTTGLIRAAAPRAAGLYVVVEARARADRLQDFVELVKSHAAASQREPGCLRFDVLQRSVVPCEFMLVEAWADQSALEAHRRTPHYARWRREIPALEATPRTHREYAAL